ncbi:TIR domain-containing protein [Methanosarcina sp. Mfa9]|uniref:TIR domain-containing protein n=1 Tax=Methanosarcina sp. Mfa9 TaxID=3439063 RepID=UPI003F85F551
MKIFISWSGKLSEEVAIILKDWMPNVIQSIKPYVSSEDIEKGTRWSKEISKELEVTNYGILCVTKENVTRPWINFEAGALSKSVSESKVCPFLIDLKTSELTRSPLSQFQSTSYDREDILKLMSSINNSCGEKRISDTYLEKSFDMWWSLLENKLDCALNKHPENVASTEIEEEIKIITSLAMSSDGRRFICVEAQNHGDKSVFLKVPSFTIKSSTDHLPIIIDSRFHESVPTGELKSGDSREIFIDLNEVENIDLLENVFFTDKICRKFKSSPEKFSNIVKSWRESENLRKH